MKNVTFTSYSVGPFAKYAAIEGWFSIGSIYAEGEDDYNNSESDSETNGNHVGELVGCRLKPHKISLDNLQIVYNYFFVFYTRVYSVKMNDTLKCSR